MANNKIPKNFFLYWSGQDFQYVHYLCVLSLLKNTQVESCEVYYDEEPKNNYYWDNLKILDGVRLARLDYASLFAMGRINKEDFDLLFSKAKVNHRSDFFRYIVLYCFGGVYLDFDVIVIKDLEPLLNTEFFIGLQRNKGYLLNGAVMGSVKASRLFKDLIDEIARISSEKEELLWADIGPSLLSRKILSRKKGIFFNIAVELLFRLAIDNKKIIAFLTRQLTEAKNVTIYPRAFFYYYNWLQWQRIFRRGSIPSGSYLLHLWGKFSHNFTKAIDEPYIKNSTCLYSNVSRKALEISRI